MSHRLQRVVHARARAGGGDRAGQHRARPARPGPAAAGARGRGGPAVVPALPTARRCRRGRARVLPGRRRVPQRAAGRAARTATSREPIARLLVFATWRLALFERLRRLTRPGARGDRGQGRQGADLPPRLRRAVGRHGWATAPRSPTRGCGRAGGVWPYVAELFAAHAVERRLAAAGVGVDPAGAARRVRRRARAGARGGDAASRPDAPRWPRRGRRRDGVHTEALGRLLAELQSVARAHPGATW